MIYRRRKDSDTWHWCTNCSNWPKEGEYIEKNMEKTTYGEKCDTCLDLSAKNKCKRV